MAKKSKYSDSEDRIIAASTAPETYWNQTVIGDSVQFRPDREEFVAAPENVNQVAFDYARSLSPDKLNALEANLLSLMNTQHKAINAMKSAITGDMSALTQFFEQDHGSTLSLISNIAEDSKLTGIIGKQLPGAVQIAGHEFNLPDNETHEMPSWTDRFPAQEPAAESKASAVKKPENKSWAENMLLQGSLAALLLFSLAGDRFSSRADARETPNRPVSTQTSMNNDQGKVPQHQNSQGSASMAAAGVASSRSARRKGMTLVEVLVVIAIIGVLVALLLPAVQAARGAAREAQNQSNLRQYGIGFANCESARGHYPHGGVNYGTDKNGQTLAFPVSWQLMNYPYIEGGNIADQYNVGYAGDAITGNPQIPQSKLAISAHHDNGSPGTQNIVVNGGYANFTDPTTGATTVTRPINPVYYGTGSGPNDYTKLALDENWSSTTGFVDGGFAGLTNGPFKSYKLPLPVDPSTGMTPHGFYPNEKVSSKDLASKGTTNVGMASYAGPRGGTFLGQYTTEISNVSRYNRVPGAERVSFAAIRQFTGPKGAPWESVDAKGVGSMTAEEARGVCTILFADGSVRKISASTDSKVLKALSSIRVELGEEIVPIP